LGRERRGSIDKRRITMSSVPGGLKAVRDFFGFKLADMKKEWTNGGLTDKDKEELLSGLLPNEKGVFTLTY
jgi:hypothetical protein